MFGGLEENVYFCTREERIREMANGYSQIYGNCIIAFYDICRYERTYHHIYSGDTLNDSIRIRPLLG